VRSYLRFVLQNRHFLAFGYLLAALSGIGQTYLIALFGEELRAAFDLSNAEFGGIYSAATLVSGFSLIWLGKHLDWMDLRVFTALVMVGAFAGCLLIAGAANTLMLGAAFYLLRVCGQGLMMHVAHTSMARYFEAGRGKALSIATLGLPSGEAVFPAAVVALIAWLGWRQAWVALGIVLLTLALPSVLWLLRGHDRRSRTGSDDQPAPRNDDARGNAHGRAHWRRREVVRDPRFYGALPAAMAPPFIMTALFFHQIPLAAEKGWTVGWLASSFTAFAAGHIGSLLAAGPLVDRFGSPALLRVYLAPLAAGLATLGLMSGPWVAPAYLGLAGLSMGVAGAMMGALWAELYGTAYLGEIRALTSAIMVLSTAVAPVLVGVVLDAGIGFDAVCLTFLVWTLLASAIAAWTVRPRRPHDA